MLRPTLPCNLNLDLDKSPILHQSVTCRIQVFGGYLPLSTDSKQRIIAPLLCTMHLPNFIPV